MRVGMRRFRAVALWTALAFAAAEAGLRMAGVHHPPFDRLDDDLGTALNPGVEGWYTDEGRAYLKVNRDGFLDREWSRAKAPGTFRIAVLGDQLTEARQVPRDETFVAILGRELSACPAAAGRAVEALNFGVAGYGTGQERIVLQRRVWDYSPDLVVVAFYTANDVRANSRRLEPNPMRPFFRYEGDRLVLDASFRESPTFARHRTRVGRWLDRALVSSRVLQVANRLRRTLRDRLRAVCPPEAADGPILEEGELEIYKEPEGPAWNEAWRVTEQLLAEMAGEAKGHGARFVLVTLSNPLQVYPGAAARQGFERRHAITDPSYADKRLQAVGARLGFPVVSLAAPLQEQADAHQAFLHGIPPHRPGDGHYNASAHALVGRLLAGALCRRAF